MRPLPTHIIHSNNTGNGSSCRPRGVLAPVESVLVGVLVGTAAAVVVLNGRDRMLTSAVSIPQK